MGLSLQGNVLVLEEIFTGRKLKVMLFGLSRSASTSSSEKIPKTFGCLFYF